MSPVACEREHSFFGLRLSCDVGGAACRAQREARCETHRAVQVALGDAKTFVESREGADAGTPLTHRISA